MKQNKDMPQYSETDMRYVISAVSGMSIKLENYKDDLKEIKDMVASHLVTQDQFSRVKDRISLLEKVVYGFIGLVLVLVLTAVVSSRLK
jgi:hypothetical protein